MEYQENKFKYNCKQIKQYESNLSPTIKNKMKIKRLIEI